MAGFFKRATGMENERQTHHMLDSERVSLSGAKEDDQAVPFKLRNR